MHVWIESTTLTLEYCLKPKQQLPGKVIKVAYKFPLHVNSCHTSTGFSLNIADILYFDL